jgi:hypothetical protein
MNLVKLYYLIFIVSLSEAVYIIPLESLEDEEVPIASKHTSTAPSDLSLSLINGLPLTSGSRTDASTTEASKTDSTTKACPSTIKLRYRDLELVATTGGTILFVVLFIVAISSVVVYVFLFNKRTRLARVAAVVPERARVKAIEGMSRSVYVPARTHKTTSANYQMPAVGFSVPILKSSKVASSKVNESSNDDHEFFEDKSKSFDNVSAVENMNVDPRIFSQTSSSGYSNENLGFREKYPRGGVFTQSYSNMC